MDLQKFCHSSSRHNIEKPFSRGNWTYATDGKIMIRVPRVEGYDADEGPKGVEEMFSDAEFCRGVTVWQPLPEFELQHGVCPICHGEGYLVPCPAYLDKSLKCTNGSGVKCQKYDDECHRPGKQTENGAVPCEWCDGKGSSPINDGPIVEGSVSPVKINNIYLDMIKDLPNVQIAPYDSNSFFLIRFDGGEGLLMPMRI